MVRIAVLATAAIALALGGIVAQADSEYPNRPVRLIAAAAPGGNPDVLARLLSQKLSGAFGKAFVVENVPGAGGVVAAKMVAATPPDRPCAHARRFRRDGDQCRASSPTSVTTRCGISPRSRRW